MILSLLADSWPITGNVRYILRQRNHSVSRHVGQQIQIPSVDWAVRRVDEIRPLRYDAF